MPSAIVTGATGILGREIVKALGKEPSKWTTVHALSRSQKEEYPKNVKHDTIDLTGNVEQMSEQLKNLTAEYVFFSAYLQKDTEQENWDVNGGMLDNFLKALESTGAIKQIKRFILVCGAKQYGLHQGRPKNPMEEHDARIDQPDRPPNFYYRQQDILFAHAKKHHYEWVVTYPNDVIGFAKNNFMNLGTSLALYAAINKQLGGELQWPGSDYFYSAATTFTSSKLQAQFCLWAAQEPKAANQAFNIVNGDSPTYEILWPRIANYFGCRIPPNQFQRAPAKEMSAKNKLFDRPPIAERAKELGLEGSPAVQPSYLEARVDLTKWHKQEKVKKAWQDLAKKYSLEEDALDKATWDFLMFVLGRNYDIMISMSKARKFGWTGYEDTFDALVDVWHELEEARMLPPKASE